MLERLQQARKFFVKATTIDSSFGPAWIAFGHTFSQKDEHEQVYIQRIFIFFKSEPTRRKKRNQNHHSTGSISIQTRIRAPHRIALTTFVYQY